MKYALSDVKIPQWMNYIEAYCLQMKKPLSLKFFVFVSNKLKDF